MAISIPSPLIEFILLGPLDDRRQLQDSPILGDVWVEFGKQPAERQDLLIAPYRGQHAGSVAGELVQGLRHRDDLARIAFLQGLIVASLTFREMMQVVAPKTKWWIKRWTGGVHEVGTKFTFESLEEDDPRDPRRSVEAVIQKILDSAAAWHSKTGSRRFKEIPALDRFLVLTALILWAGEHEDEEPGKKRSSDDQIAYILEKAAADRKGMSALLKSLADAMLSDPARDPLVWQVSRNRSAVPALSRSIPAVKADAATYLFKVNCSEIGWAVVDSGIDGSHPAFLDKEGKSRVKRSFDFKNFRRIVSLSNMKPAIRKSNLAKIKEDAKLLLQPLDDKTAEEDLKTLAEDALRRGPVHWELVEKFIEIRPDTEPYSHHGTHVAGILGASKTAAEKSIDRTTKEKAARKAQERAAVIGPENAAREAVEEAMEDAGGNRNPDVADGMCPDILLYDFRVLGQDLQDTEFAIIAALQFIRHLNDRDNFLMIHGANLSLSIPHDVRNFACGRTPVCDECERLVSSGVVVVAAAGNHGYKSFETKEGSFDTYSAFSITDPGNADNVLTVGATHRFWPHTYGVSFFSSRGPTGDGRMKPDLVAPGERIRAPLPGGDTPGGDWGDLDGTSMAAPHVSGAAAMLMARYSELVGHPLRIKRILCDSATDLGRERSFQGHGMLDVLRAFQTI